MGGHSGGLSEDEAVANIAKAVMGAGVFSLPWATSQGGLIFVPAFICGAALLALYTLSILVAAKRALLADQPAAVAVLSSYTGIVETALGPTAGRVAEVMNLACCFGICSAYLVFIASTLATVVAPGGGVGAQTAAVLAITPAMIALSWLRSMAGVSVMAAVGNASVLAGMAFVVYSAASAPWQLASVPLAAPRSFGSYFGSVAFLFFIHFTLPAIESAMAAPGRFMAATTKAFALCGAVGAAFGVIGAAAYGPSVASNVITQLGGGWTATVVKLLLVMNLFFTFPIVCRSAFLVIESGAERAGWRLSPAAQKGVRAAFVASASATAVLVPSFGSLLALVGGVSLSVISLLFPPLILLAGTTRGGARLLPSSPAERALAVLIAAAGVAIAVYTIVG